eukprot:TRINITY_DN75702_c0_g1_i1.p1 TRINITY_DN75702_c0_g1~~TRINITY_DN75702_c0_g1_i1.p1  ORF type:complete len:343 (+),score=63.66 TRINITY_DN75702_c0_g1_i1:95-1030(+)
MAMLRSLCLTLRHGMSWVRDRMCWLPRPGGESEDLAAAESTPQWTRDLAVGSGVVEQEIGQAGCRNDRRERSHHCGEDLNQPSRKLPDEFCWRSINELSTSTASTQMVDAASIGEDEDDIELDSRWTEPTRFLRLPCGLHFYEKTSRAEDLFDRTPLKAESLACLPRKHDKEKLHLVGRRGGGSPQHQEASFGDDAVWASADDLLVDCRVGSEDSEPNFVRLKDAELGSGRVLGLRLSSQEGGESPVLVEVSKKSSETAFVALQDAVEQLREKEVDRKNREMMIYQRQLCSMMMASQRRRYLGLQEPCAVR